MRGGWVEAGDLKGPGGTTPRRADARLYPTISSGGNGSISGGSVVTRDLTSLSSSRRLAGVTASFVSSARSLTTGRILLTGNRSSPPLFDNTCTGFSMLGRK